MKIAQVAPVSPVMESVPPRYYGGTERIISYLTEELVAQGHDVTLFASGDSVTEARLEPTVPRALRLERSVVDAGVYHLLLLNKLIKRATSFDIIHFHTDYWHFPFCRQFEISHLTTLHGRLDLPDLVPLYREFDDLPLVSISEVQRAPLPFVNWAATIHHGIPEQLYPFQPEPGKYLAFLGRISPEKRVDRAIEIATRAGMELKIAAKVDNADRVYFEEKIKTLLRHPLVEYIGEIGEHEKSDFLGNALALLFPIDWCEPFGLVMIEAMACGTPVIAYRKGSVPEVVRDGVTGFVVDNLSQALHALERIEEIDRRRCRMHVVERFSAKRMAQSYTRVYESVLRN